MQQFAAVASSDAEGASPKTTYGFSWLSCLQIVITAVIFFFIGKMFCPEPPPPPPPPPPPSPAPTPPEAGYAVTSFTPYYNYEGPLNVSGSGIVIQSMDGDYRTKTLFNLGGGQIISFELSGVDKECSGNPPNVPNACGIHIHQGKSCSEDAGGHFWNKTELPMDPWKYVGYTSDKDGKAQLKEVLVLTSLLGQEVFGHTMIIHDSTGARVACGIIESPKLQVPALGVYPGYEGDLVVTGTVKITGGRTYDGLFQNITWDLKGLPEKCKKGPGDSPNSCGIHIHAGMTCADAGGHYYATPEDPWKNVVFNSGKGCTGPVYTGLPMANVTGHTFVVHDFDGTRVACGIIQPLATMVPGFDAYGFYDGSLQVSGEATITGTGYGLEATQFLSWNLTGVDPMCTEPVPEDAPANACGIHIHTKDDCSNAGGHFYNPDLTGEDPWKHITYTAVSGRTDAKNVKVVTGKNQWDIFGRTIVVHDHKGTRVGCGFITVQAVEETENIWIFMV